MNGATESTATAIESTHPNVIIHLDIDCFYAQVEEIRNPSLRDKPLGILQNNSVVTSNYVARGYGIHKMTYLKDALVKCPELVLVNGEDLTPYRQMSNKVHNILLQYTSNVEKLGLDENFLDVTSIIEEKLATTCSGDDVMMESLLDSYMYPDNETLSSCDCGCEMRLKLGAKLAMEIRQKLYAELGITTCAGIAHNKLLAKIIGSKHKPNKQTVLIPACTNEMMIGLGSVRAITGIGARAEQQLNDIGVETVQQLQLVDFAVLQKMFGYDVAMKYRNWSRGVDRSAVVQSGKPKSISFEDSCRSISFRADVEEKFRLLLIRLVNQVAEDGRIPLVVKIMVRKFDAVKKTSHRETKQANIMPSVFRQMGNGKVVLIENGQEKLLKIVMKLFERVVNLKMPFNITLLGLAFSKFQERSLATRSVANFLIRTDLEVQSITSLSSDGVPADNYQARCSPAHMDFDTISEASHASYQSDLSESEIEPSPKKHRIGLSSLAKRRCMAADLCTDTASPSKLRVGDLRLNSKESDTDFAMQTTSSNASTPNNSLPTTPVSSPLALPMIISPLVDHPPTQPPIAAPTAATSTVPARNVPPIVDPEVFKELPFEVQEELLNVWNPPHPEHTDTHAKVISRKPTNGKTVNSKTSKTNTLHRFFIKQTNK